MSIRTTVGQVALAGGVQSSRPGSTLIDERASRSARDRRKGNLYLLVEVAGPAASRDLLARQIVELLHQVYYRRQGGVTAGLQQAIREANDLLFEENRNALPGEQQTAGVSCVVLREDDLFVAQAGPAAVYLARAGQVTRFPDLSPWLDNVPLEELDAAPLGARREPNVALFHTEVGPGDRFLIVESMLARRLAPHILPGILTRAPADAAVDALVAAGGGRDLSALVVHIEEEDAEPVPAGPVVEEHRSTGEMVAGTFSGLADRIHAGEWLGAVGRALGAAFAAAWAALATLVKRMLPGQVSPPAAPQGRASPLPQAVRRPAGEPPRSTPPRRWVTWLVIAVPVVVAVVVLGMVVRRGQEQRAELDELWSKAEQAWSNASAATDGALIRAGLQEASEALDAFIARRPEDAEALALRDKVRARFDEIGGVRRITDIAALKTYPAGSDLTRVVFDTGHVFVLDRNADQVYHHRLDSDQKILDPSTVDTVLVSKGSSVGDVLVNDLVDMVWISAGEGRQKGVLGILESDGGLLLYDPALDSLTAVRLPTSETWQLARLVGSYFGRFYVLDSKSSKIWRYLPTADGYSSLPDDWLQAPADLSAAEDLAIGDSIYILLADGSIQRFTTGQPQAFDLSTWDVPPRNASAVFTRPPDQMRWVYVADRGNRRLVRTSPEGRFEGQFLLADPAASGDALSGVTSLFVDEIGGRAFFLSGLQLYRVELPAQ